MENISLILFMLFNFFLLSFLGSKINSFSDSGVIFGLRVPIAFRSKDEITIINNKFKKLTLISCFISTLVSFLLISISFDFALIAQIYLLLISISIPYIIANKEMKVIKKKYGWKALSKNRVILALDNKNKDKKLNLFWFAIPIYIGITNLIAVIMFYPKKNIEIPMHFDFFGNVTNFASSDLVSTKMSVFMIPLLSIGTSILSLIIIKYFVRRGTRLNGGKKSDILKEKAVFKHEISLLFLFTSIITSSLFLFLTSITLGVLNLSNTVIAIFCIISFVLLTLVPIIFLARILKARKLNINNTNSDDELYKDDDDFYKFGLFYYNPNDPTIMVEKRVGIGYDFNYATFTGKIFLVITVLVVLLTLLIPFFTK